MAPACLAGVQILCAAPTDEEEDQLRSQVQALGGTPLCLEDVAGDVQPSHLVATSVLTPAYKMLVEHSAWIPRLAPTWLDACHRAGRKVPVEGHTLKVLEGISISISGMVTKEKARYSELVTKHGGIYSAELTKLCTHLVVSRRGTHPGKPREVSNKERHSRMWRTVHVVWDSWLASNIEAGHYKADEARHLVPEEEDSGLAQAAPGAAPAQPGNMVEARDTGAAKESSGGTLPTIGTRVAQPAASGQPAGAQSRESGGECPSGALPGVEEEERGVQADSRLRAPPARIAESREVSPVSNLAPARSPNSGSGGRRRSASSGSNDDDTLFLSGATVHLACCTPAEQLEALRILREGGCTRRPDLRNDVTHVVVGSDLTPQEVKAIGDHAREHAHISRIVPLDWLRQCLSVRDAVPVDDSLALSMGSLGSMLAQSQQAAKEAKEAAAAAASKLRATQADGEGASRQGGDPADRFLDGYFFTLSALPAKGKDEEFSRKAIRQAGGRIFDRRTMDLVVAKDKAFAVCPPSMLREESALLSKNCPDFRLVPERNWVTPLWLDASLDQRRPLLPIPYERVECQPLPYPIPIPGMSEFTFCASNLDPQVKDSVKGLVKLLGGQYTIKMGHRNTHLVVPFAAGDKYRGAMRFEVAPITYKWLIDVAKSGKLLPEKNYHPPPMGPDENPDQSQFPFESTAAAPSQDAARGTQTAGGQAGGGGFGGSLFRQVMAPSNSNLPPASQRAPPPSKPAWKPAPRLPKPPSTRSSQGGPSRLDSLFSQLPSPAKAPPPPSVAARGSGGTAARDLRGMTASKTADAAAEPKESARGAESPPSTAAGDSFEGSEEDGTRAENGDEEHGGPENGAVALPGTAAFGSAEEPADFLEHLDRITENMVKNVPLEVSQASQPDLMMPPPKARLPSSSNASEELSGSRGPSPRRRGARRADSAASEDSVAARKRARGSSRQQASSRPPHVDIDASQFCSQQVGYEGVSHSGMAFPTEARPSAQSSGGGRPTRVGRAASKGVDQDLARQRLAKAATRRGGGARGRETTPD